MPAKILTSTENMPYEDWLEYRKRGIGGSDASVVCVNAHLKMSVFAEKECHFSPDSIQVYTALTTTSLVGLKSVKP